MPVQSEAALEAGLIATLRQMDYEYVQIAEEDNLQANFKRQLEIHNRKRLAVHGQTAAELIVNRADAEKEHMGLTTWENAPDGKIVKTDRTLMADFKDFPPRHSLYYGRLLQISLIHLFRPGHGCH